MSKTLERYLSRQIEKDLSRKMVFVGGPRQVGKTTMALRLLKDEADYLNWDIRSHRRRILQEEWPTGSRWVLDEIHKYRGWRNLLKGLFDEFRNKRQLLVTGSARLDYYRFGGDSLQGRYHYLRLHPLSVGELKVNNSPDFHQLLMLGGFPEPFFGGSEEEARRWSSDYRTRLIEEDIRGIEAIHDVGKMELLMMRLPELVGSPLSINSLCRDLELNHRTVARWVEVLEKFYALFRLAPFGAPVVRAVKKERKHYHFDWTAVEKNAFRFENCVASHLKKWIDFDLDAHAKERELRYFRDVNGREVDFVVTENRKPILFVECKWDDEEIHPALRYARARFSHAEFWQLSAVGKKDYLSSDGIRVAPALAFLKTLI